MTRPWQDTGRFERTVSAFSPILGDVRSPMKCRPCLNPGTIGPAGPWVGWRFQLLIDATRVRSAARRFLGVASVPRSDSFRLAASIAGRNVRLLSRSRVLARPNARPTRPRPRSTDGAGSDGVRTSESCAAPFARRRTPAPGASNPPVPTSVSRHGPPRIEESVACHEQRIDLHRVEASSGVLPGEQDHRTLIGPDFMVGAYSCQGERPATSDLHPTQTR